MAQRTHNPETFTDVVGFEIVGDYTQIVLFADDSERQINLEPILIGPLFGELRDLRLFNQARVNADIGSLVWPNGADIDPNVLHEWPQHVDAIAARRRAQARSSAPR